MHTLLELAERCERATAPDRELDGEIGRTLGREPVGLARVTFPRDPSDERYASYTASLDAALTLIDPEWDVAVMWNRDEREAYATVGPNALAGFSLGEGKGRGLNATDAKARALCAAALKARAAQEVSA